MLPDSLLQRTCDKLPFSVATALAIQALGGEHPDRLSEIKPIKDYDRVLINIRTMVRNIYGSVKTDDAKLLKAKDVYTVIQKEMEDIEHAISQYSDNTCKVTFYGCSFNRLKMLFPNAIHKTISTTKQRHYFDLESVVVKQSLLTIKNHDVLKCDVGVAESYPERCIILTHYPTDLITSEIRHLDLLESHTGHIKGPSEWGTKLTKGKSLERIPFNRLTIQIFGDNDNLLAPLAPNIKTKVLEIAEKKKWNRNTTYEKVYYDLTNNVEQDFKTIMLLLSKNNAL